MDAEQARCRDTVRKGSGGGIVAASVSPPSRLPASARSALLLLALAAILGAGLGAVETIAQRRHRVEAMTPDQREDLLRNEQQFHALPIEEQKRIRDLHAAIDNSPDRDKLLAVMNRYCKWFEDQPPWFRGHLQRLKPKKRVDEIKIQLAKRKITGNEIRLDDKNRQAVARWMDHYTTEHEAHVIETMVQGPRNGVGKPQPGMPRGNAVGEGETAGGLAKLPPQVQHRVAREWLYHRWKSGNPDLIPQVSKEEMASLRASLSPEIRARLEARPAVEQVQIIADWLRDTASAELDERLAEFFETTLNDEQRDGLMSLPGDDMNRKLREMYELHLTRQSKAGEPPHRGDHRPHGHIPGAPRGSAGRHWLENQEERASRIERESTDAAESKPSQTTEKLPKKAADKPGVIKSTSAKSPPKD